MTKRRTRPTSSAENAQCDRLTSVLLDPDVFVQRLQAYEAHTSRILSYRRLWHSIAAAPAHQKEECRRLGAALSERAFDTERHARGLAAVALTCLNHSLDTGFLDSAMARAASRVTERTDVIRRALQQARRLATLLYPDLDTTFIVEAEKVARPRRLVVTAREREFRATMVTLDGESRRFTVNTRRPVGRLGRVTAEDLLGYSAMTIASHTPIVAVDDCHHRTQQTRPKGSGLRLEPYSSLVSSIALGREMMYQHARQIDELGLTAIRGNTGDSTCDALILTLAAILCLVLAGGFGYKMKGSTSGPPIQIGGPTVGSVDDTGVTFYAVTVSLATDLILAAVMLSGITAVNFDGGAFHITNLLPIQG